MTSHDPQSRSPFIPATVGQAIRGVRTHMPALVSGLWLTVLLATVGTAGRLLVPVMVQQVVSLITHPPVVFAQIVGILGAGALASAVASACQVVAIRRMGVAVEAGLCEARLAALDRMHQFSIAQQQLAPRGQLISRLTSDLDDIAGYLSYGMILLVLSLLQIVVVAVVMVVWAWPLALIVAVCTALYALVAVRVQVQIAPAFTQARENAGTMQGVLAETIMGAEVIQAFAIAQRTESRVVDAIEDTRLAETHGGFLSSFYSGITVGFQAIVTVLTLLASVLLVANGQLNVGVALAFPFLVNLYTDPMIWFGESLSQAQLTLASWRRVCGLLDTPPEIPDPARCMPDSVRPLPDGPLSIRLQGVQMTYPHRATPALWVDDLVIPAGQQVAIVGETGSGKTTLSKLVTRLVLPSEGTILIGGVDLKYLSEADLRAHVLMVPQDDVLMSSSLRANLHLAAPDADDAALTAALDDLGLSEWVAQLPHGLDTELGERGANLSAGQRQLIGLIRAHLATPQVLVLDEATSALDPATERLVRQTLGTLVTSRTTLTIAHRLTTAAEADRILVIHQGRIVEDGTHQDLHQREGGHYAALWADWEKGITTR